MPWVQIQHASEATWDDYEKVAGRLEIRKADGLIVWAAGEVDGHWKAVRIWESREAHDHFVEARVVPAVREALGEEIAAAGPPPTEWFEVKHMMDRR
jgi:hypothetical protein